MSRIVLAARVEPIQLFANREESQTNFLVCDPDVLDIRPNPLTREYRQAKRIHKEFLETFPFPIQTHLPTKLSLRDIVTRIMLETGEHTAGDPAYCFPESIHDYIYPMFFPDGKQFEVLKDIARNSRKYRR